MTKKKEFEFMRLAVEKAKESKSEDNQVHPYVGAVVVTGDKILGSACRGDCAPGDHAEYTVLERKLNTSTLSGCTIYTTLEPCTTRNHPKIPCVNRIIDRHIDRVVIGMLDPNQAITGKGVLQLRRAGIAVDFFPRELMTELEEMNRDFIRKCQTDQVCSQQRGIIEGGLNAFYPSRDYYAERVGGNTIDKYVGSAQFSVTMISVNLMTGIPFNSLCRCLKEKLTNPQIDFHATISLLDPRLNYLMSAMAPTLRMMPSDLSRSICNSIKALFEMKEQLNVDQQRRCDIRLHKAIPFGSIIMLDHHKDNGRIQIETKPYQAGLQNSFAFEIKRASKISLYEVLINSFETLLDDGESLTNSLEW